MNDPMIQWSDMVTEWLALVEPQLRAHAIQAAAGERGVLIVKVSKAQMQVVLATKKLQPGTTTRIEMEPTTFVPMESFVEDIREGHVDPTAAERYRPVLEAMDPTKDVALYLSSALDGSDGGIYSRFLMLAEFPHE